MEDLTYEIDASRESITLFIFGEKHVRYTMDCLRLAGYSMESFEKHIVENFRYIPRGVPGEPEKKEPAKSIGALIREQQAAKASSSCAKRDSDENHRPALTWDTKTPFDSFGAGWIVKSGRDVDDAEYNTGSQSDPLQKLGDTSNPLHGSAFLKGK